jgi:purine-binding chemotaxis protein CheW
MSTAAPEGEKPARADLLVRLHELEGQVKDVKASLLALGGEALPGLHLVLTAFGHGALLAASLVHEVVRIVATRPLAGAPAYVSGTFVCRGTPVVVVDLGRLLGSSAEPELDAQVVVLSGTPALGLLVDRVQRLVEDPLLFSGEVLAGTPKAWRGSKLVAGLCVVEGEVLPVLDPSPLWAEVAGRDA